MTSLHPGPARRKNAGFTLIELMITVAIVAILSAIAYPSYRNYVIRGQLVDATNGLSALRANMERYYQDNRTYMSTSTVTSPCLAAAPTLVVGSFQLSCSVAPTLTTYTLQAAGGYNGNNNTKAFTYTVDNTNVMTTVVGSPAPAGWASCTTGWVTKPGGC